MLLPGPNYEHYDQNTPRSTLPALPPPLNQRLGQLGKSLYDRILLDNGAILKPWRYERICTRYRAIARMLEAYTSIPNESHFRENGVLPYINCHFASYDDVEV
jgi:hypothetical protein